MVRIVITKLMYGWSKYGGGNKGLVKEMLDEWYCQACSELQRKELPSYMVLSATREFMRVCSRCKNRMVRERLKDYWKLLDSVRHA